MITNIYNFEVQNMGLRGPVTSSYRVASHSKAEARAQVLAKASSEIISMKCTNIIPNVGDAMTF